MNRRHRWNGLPERREAKPFNGHHVWCNFDTRKPADDCNCKSFHEKYPMTEDDPAGIELAAKHFPNAIPRT